MCIHSIGYDIVPLIPINQINLRVKRKQLNLKFKRDRGDQNEFRDQTLEYNLKFIKTRNHKGVIHDWNKGNIKCIIGYPG